MPEELDLYGGEGLVGLMAIPYTMTGQEEKTRLDQGSSFILQKFTPSGLLPPARSQVGSKHSRHCWGHFRFKP